MRTRNTKVDWLSKHLPDREDQRFYAQERAIVAATEALLAVMEEAGVTRQQVAEAMGKSKAHVSRLLRGDRNMTLRSLADVLWVCNKELVNLDLAPLGVVELPGDMLWSCEFRVGSGSSATTELLLGDYEALVPRLAASTEDHADKRWTYDEGGVEG